MLTASELKDWILVISASVSMISVAIGIFVTLGQYRMKLRDEKLKSQQEERLAASARAEEARLALSTRADVDIRLFKSFAELMDLAQGRRGNVVSEKAMEELFKLKLITEKDFSEDFTKVQTGSQKFQEYAVVPIPVGLAAQEAAIAAIATLAKDYPVLQKAALRGLKSMKEYDVAQEYAREIESQAPVAG